MAKAVVIGKSDVIRLCAARALGVAGYSVDIIRLGGRRGRLLKSPDYYCKYADNFFFFDITAGTSLSSFLVEKYKSSHQKPVIVSLDDQTTHLLDVDRQLLGNYFLMAHLRDDSSLSDLMDKHLLKEKAKSKGLSVTQGWPIPYECGEFIIPEDIKYPCFIKGLYSYWNSKGIQRKCNSREELDDLVSYCKTHYPYALYAEEYVEIEKEMGIIGVSDGVRCVIPAETELLVMGDGSSHGVSILGQIKPIAEDNEIKKRIEWLISELGYIGIFNIDFIKTKESTLFVELNFRFATYGYGVFKAGVNLPAMFADSLSKMGGCVFPAVLDGEHFYLNEEVAYNNLIENKLSLSEYRRLKKRADVLFVESDDDPKPKKQLKRVFVLKYLVGRLRRVAGR